MFVLLSRVDFGEMMNRIHRRQYYQPGEVVQVHCLILGSHVWIERAYICGEAWYRVAFGRCPKIGELITLEELQKTIKDYFLNLVEVIP